MKQAAQSLNDLADYFPQQPLSLRNRADDLLVSVAVLGLIASIADGEPDYREVESFSQAFRKQFALSRRKATRLIGAALKRISGEAAEAVVCSACQNLNDHLTEEQRLKVFDALTEVLIADGVIKEGEEVFLDYVARRLLLVVILERRERTGKVN